MTQRLLASALLATVVLAAPAAHAVNGFTIGLEGARGGWEADPAKIEAGSGGQLAPGTANLFTNPIDGQTRNGLHLHFGWNILGHAAIEAAIQTSAWSPFNGDRGGAALVGGRVTWFPAEIAWPGPRQFDGGLDVGYGYSIAGGPDLGMDGTYLALGVHGEYYPVPWFSLGIGYRQYRASWDRFFLDYDNDVIVPIKDFTATWGTVDLQFTFHVARD